MDNLKVLSLISESNLEKQQKDALLGNLANIILDDNVDRRELDMIVNSDLSKEQRDVVLGLFADKLIKEKVNDEKSVEISREETIAKANKQSAELRERLDAYNKRGLEKEQERKKQEERNKYIKEVLEKEKILSELKNNNGERPYSDLSGESYSEIERIYSQYEGTYELEQAMEAYEQKKLNGGMNPEEQTNTNDEVQFENNEVQNENDDITLDELNAVKSDDITLDELESAKSAVGPSLDEINLEPEGRKKLKIFGRSKDSLKNFVDGNAAKAVIAIAGGIAALTLLVTNFPALLAVGAGAYIGNEFNKGKKL